MLTPLTYRAIPGRHVSAARRITAMIPGLVILLALLWLAHELALEERIVLFRYLAMAFAGCMAFITPHMLFPDGDKTLVLQLNPSPRRLFLHHLVKLRALWLYGLAAIAVIAFGDSVNPAQDFHEKTRLFAAGLIALTAIILYALYRFATIGASSQRWNEGKSGRRLFESLDSVGKSIPVDAGMFPTFLSTILVTFVGMMVVVVSAAIPHMVLAILPFVLFLGYSGFLLGREIRHYDRRYYQSDAFYYELFTNPATGSKESREPASYGSIYWVPKRWRAAVWTQLVQLDRKRPMGRIIALLSFTYWLLIWLGTPESWHAGWLLFWILAKNMLAWPVSDPAISPPVFHWWMLPPRDWMIARFFLQTRWTLAFLLTVAAAALFSEAASWQAVWMWTLADVAVSAVSAWLLSRSNEFAFRRRYA